MAADIKKSEKLIGLMLQDAMTEVDYDRQKLLTARSAFMLAVHKLLLQYEHPERRQVHVV